MERGDCGQNLRSKFALCATADTKDIEPVRISATTVPKS